MKGHLRRNKRGAAVVEFAIVLPVFVLILMGSIETCSMIFLQQTLEMAAYEGARVAIEPKTTFLNVESAAKQILKPRRIRNSSISVIPSDFQSAPYGTFLRVSVSVPCSSNSVIASRFYSSRTLTANVEMMKEF
ncbi:MAG: TadE/TadG family type IV pilus assembly protein [Pirellula staleyi]